METPSNHNSGLIDATKRVTWRLLAMFHNRVELLMVEIQEERQRALRAVLMATAAAFLSLLAGMTVTAVIACAAGTHMLTALIIMAIVYIAGTVFFLLKLARMQRNWDALSSTRDQLQKDRECLEEHLA
jgi:uncharacterized membrane protein YqjE